MADIEEIPTEIFRTRLLSLQLLCQSEGLDAIVFVPGVDGRWNYGSALAVRYLCLGEMETGGTAILSLGTWAYPGGAALEASARAPGGLGAGADALEDAALVVCPPGRGGALVYRDSLLRPPGGHHHLAALARAWPGCREYRLPCRGAADEDEDHDALERQKARCFAQAVLSAVGRRAGARVGLPLDPTGTEEENGGDGGAAQEAERWPLIQSFALGDGVSAGVFFSLQYEVVGVGPQVAAAVFGADALAARSAARAARGPFATHWQQAMRNVERVAGGQRAALTEAAVVEPLSLLHEFSELHAHRRRHRGGSAGSAEGKEEEDEEEGRAAHRGLRPRALFGPRAALVATPAAANSAATLGEAQAAAAAPGGECPVVLEGAEPQAALRACRTYFLAGRGGGGGLGGGGGGLLGEAYRRLVAAHRGALARCAAAAAGRTGADALTLQRVLDAAAAAAAGGSAAAATAEALLDLTDARGEEVDRVGPLAPGLAYVRLSLVLEDERGRQIGGVAVGDTAALGLPWGEEEEEGGGGGHAPPAVLTGGGVCPYFQVWDSGREAIQSEVEEKMLVENFGPLVENGGPHAGVALVQAVPGGGALPAVAGALAVRARGWTLLGRGGWAAAAGPGGVVCRMGAGGGARLAAVARAGDGSGDLLLAVRAGDGSGDLVLPAGRDAAAAAAAGGPVGLALVLPSGSGAARAVLRAAPSWQQEMKAAGIPFYTLSETTAMEEGEVEDGDEAAAGVLRGLLARLRAQRARSLGPLPPADVRALARGALGAAVARAFPPSPSMAAAAAAAEGGNPGARPLVTAVLGPAGAGVLEFAHALWAHVRADTEERWVLACASALGDGKGTGPRGEPNLAELAAEAKAQAAAAAAVGAGQRGGRPPRVLVAAQGPVTAAALAQSLRAAGLRVGTVACCVQPADLKEPYLPGFDQKLTGEELPEDAHCWPAPLGDQLRRGWATHAVVAPPPPNAPAAAAAAAAFRARARAAHPGLALLGGLGPGGADPAVLEELASASAPFEAPAFEKARCEDFGKDWASLSPFQLNLEFASPASEHTPDWRGLKFEHYSGGQLPDAQCLAEGLRLLFPNARTSIAAAAADVGLAPWRGRGNPRRLRGVRRALDLAAQKVEAERLRREGRAKLHQVLRGLATHKHLASTGRITGVTAVFRRSSPGAAEGKGGAAAAAGLLVEASPALVRVAALSEPAFADAVGLSSGPTGGAAGAAAVWGRDLSALAADYVEKVLRAAAPYLPAARDLRTRDSLTDIEIKRIERQHNQDPLPEGWFFDGSVYVDINGNRLTHRPDIDHFIEKFIETENRRISDAKAEVVSY